MTSQNKFFDDMSRMMTNAMGVAQGAKSEAENAFIAGVFSLLDVMLEQHPAQALESVVLPATVRDALLANTGPLAPLLAVAKACESGDDEQFAQAANALGLTNHQVNWAHVQALAWADSLE